MHSSSCALEYLRVWVEMCLGMSTARHFRVGMHFECVALKHLCTSVIGSRHAFVVSACFYILQ